MLRTLWAKICSTMLVILLYPWVRAVQQTQLVVVSNYYALFEWALEVHQKNNNNSTHLVCQLSIIMISVLNQMIKHSAYLMRKHINHFVIILFHFLPHRLERIIVKSGIHGGTYIGLLCGCSVRPMLVTAGLDGKYGLMEYTTTIASYAYAS